MIRFACPKCKAVLEGPDSWAGSQVACSKCGQQLLVPLTHKPQAIPAKPQAVPAGKLEVPHERNSKKRRFIIVVVFLVVLAAIPATIVYIATKEKDADNNPRPIAGGHNPSQPTTDNPDLTADEQIAWVKDRRDHSGGRRHAVVVYFISNKAWKVHAYDFALHTPTCWTWRNGDGYLFPDVDEAKKFALMWSKESSVKLTAVIDVYSQPRPVIVAWCQDVGDGAKVISRCPTPDLEAALSRFITDYQREASR